MVHQLVCTLIFPQSDTQVFSSCCITSEARVVLPKMMQCCWMIMVALFPATSSTGNFVDRPLIWGTVHHLNNITIPHCHLMDPSSCNDNNACTINSYDAAQDICIQHQVITCDNRNCTTFNTCNPTSGCRHTNYEVGQSLSSIKPLTYFYEDTASTSLGETEVLDIIKWIQVQGVAKEWQKHSASNSQSIKGKESIQPAVPTAQLRTFWLLAFSIVKNHYATPSIVS